MGPGGEGKGGERGRKAIEMPGFSPLFLLVAHGSSGLAWREKPAAFFSQTTSEPTLLSQQPAASTGLTQNWERVQGQAGSPPTGTSQHTGRSNIQSPAITPTESAVTRSLEKPAALASGCDSPSRWGEEEEVAGLGHPRPHFPSGRRPRAGRHTLEGPGRQAVACRCPLPSCPQLGPAHLTHAGFLSSGQRFQTCRQAASSFPEAATRAPGAPG